MTNLAEIQEAIEKLAPEERAALREMNLTPTPSD
jgi:hypothetical protein